MTIWGDVFGDGLYVAAQAVSIYIGTVGVVIGVAVLLWGVKSK